MGGAYYNEWDKDAAAWLRELIKRGLIADGEVDERSILDVTADDLRSFTQCHFFAGIGGWSYALRLAGWPDDVPVWTGSPPCQPFSSAGRKKGKDDERHLAPKFASLVGACCPTVLFGEQVASADVFGGAAKPSRKQTARAPEWAWLDDLSDRLEAARYAVGASDLPSAGIGAPHIRQRTFFGAVRLADADTASERVVGRSSCQLGAWQTRDTWSGHRSSSQLGGLADADDAGLEGWILSTERGDQRPAGARGLVGGLGDSLNCGRQSEPDVTGSDGKGMEPRGRQQEQLGKDGCSTGGLGDANLARWDRITGSNSSQESGGWGRKHADAIGASGAVSNLVNTGRTSPPDSLWADADWLFCRDGKWRPVEPGTFPLAYGIPARVGRLRGYGNAINPWAAKAFIEAFCESIAMGDADEELL